MCNGSELSASEPGLGSIGIHIHYILPKSISLTDSSTQLLEISFISPPYGMEKKKNHKPAWLVNMSCVQLTDVILLHMWEAETVTALDLPMCTQCQ